MDLPLTIPISTGIYGRESGYETLMVQLPTAAPTARDVVAAHVSAGLEQTLLCQAVGASGPARPMHTGRDQQEGAVRRAWSALAERRTLLMVDDAIVADLDSPLNLSDSSQISLVQVLPLLIGG